MKNKAILFILLCIVVITTAAFLYWDYAGLHNEVQPEGNQIVPSIDQVSEISGKQKLYENKQLSLRFNFPDSWHLGSDTLSDTSRHGHLQLFNYDESSASSKSFLSSQNKIEVTIADNYQITASSDYPKKSRIESAIPVIGGAATRTDITLVDGQSYRVIVIPMKSDFLRMVIYGDPTNFGVLDLLLKSIDIH